MAHARGLLRKDLYRIGVLTELRLCRLTSAGGSLENFGLKNIELQGVLGLWIRRTERLVERHRWSEAHPGFRGGESALAV